MTQRQQPLAPTLPVFLRRRVPRVSLPQPDCATTNHVASGNGGRARRTTPMGCGSSSDADNGIPVKTAVMVIGESPHKGRTGTVKVAGAKKTVVTVMDKIDSDGELTLKTVLLIATGPAGGDPEPESLEEEETPEALKRREKDLARERKAAAAKASKEGKKVSASTADGRTLEMERDESGKVVIAAERKHKSKKKKLQDGRTATEKKAAAERAEGGRGTKYKLNKERNKKGGLDLGSISATSNVNGSSSGAKGGGTGGVVKRSGAKLAP